MVSTCIEPVLSEIEQKIGTTGLAFPVIYLNEHWLQLNLFYVTERSSTLPSTSTTNTSSSSSSSVSYAEVRHTATSGTLLHSRLSDQPPPLPHPRPADLHSRSPEVLHSRGSDPPPLPQSRSLDHGRSCDSSVMQHGRSPEPPPVPQNRATDGPPPLPHARSIETPPVPHSRSSDPPPPLPHSRSEHGPCLQMELPVVLQHRPVSPPVPAIRSGEPPSRTSNLNLHVQVGETPPPVPVPRTRTVEASATPPPPVPSHPSRTKTPPSQLNYAEIIPNACTVDESSFHAADNKMGN